MSDHPTQPGGTAEKAASDVGDIADVAGVSVPAQSRPIPRWLADVVQALELDQQRLVTVADVLRVRPELDPRVARTALVELNRRGWISPVGVRGAYEFIPGAVAGPFPSGDPWLVLRAALRRRPGAFHVGANSAAWLLGYAERAPRPHIVVADTAIPIPRPLRATYRVLTTRPAPAHAAAAGLPVPTPPELFAEIAQLAPRLHLDAAAGWLRRLLRDVDPTECAGILGARSVTARARAGYMAEACGAAEHATAIAPLVPPRSGPFYTGPVRQDGPFSPRWRVYDSGHVAGSGATGAALLTGATGSTTTPTTPTAGGSATQ